MSVRRLADQYRLQDLVKEADDEFLGLWGLGFRVYPKAPCLCIIPTLGPKVYKYDLHWAIWSVRVYGLD